MRPAALRNLLFYDAAYPPKSPPVADGVCIYLGGDTPHVWSKAEIQNALKGVTYILPIWVRSNPPGPGASVDVADCVKQLQAVGAPKGCLVAWDMETSVSASYILAVYTLLKAAGYVLIVYGSQSVVMGNQVPDGLYWGADWTSVQHLARGDEITQYANLGAYDEDLAMPVLPFWNGKTGKVSGGDGVSVTPTGVFVTVQLSLPVLAKGAKDVAGQHQSVHDIQGIMIGAGTANQIPELMNLKPDGVFGPATDAAVRRAQQLWGFTGPQVDGVWGPATWTRALT